MKRGKVKIEERKKGEEVGDGSNERQKGRKRRTEREKRVGEG